MTPASGSGSQAADWNASGKSASEEASTLRLWRTFMNARCFMAAVLLLLQGFAYGLHLVVSWVPLALSALYLAVTLLGLRYGRFKAPLRHFGAGWLGPIGFDLALFALLQLQPGGHISYTPIFILPVLMAAVLGTMSVGLGTAALATLVLLGDVFWRNVLHSVENAPYYAQAALAGTGLFMVALLAHQLVLRLAREEIVALRSRSNAHLHAQVSELVIETLNEGVLVVDIQNQVHSSNPAADAILGLAPLEPPFALDMHPAWQPLAAAARETFARRQDQSTELTIVHAQDMPREVRVRTRLTSASDQQASSLCVMFLQDLREIEARIHTEKLAAMGRMSAAVAHEIRNPLTAITQAGALLAEDLTDPAQRRLTTMVQDNARRLARIVDDILDISRTREQRALPLDESTMLDPKVRAFASEWMRHANRPHLAMHLDADGALVRLDAEHLRRILVNLLDNAARYAGTHEDSIQILTQRDDGAGRAVLRVWSDGESLSPSVQLHMFEPFFSSESRSSGLGLFICRELCERYGAAIGYRRCALVAGGPEGNEFWISFASGQASDRAPAEKIAS